MTGINVKWQPASFGDQFKERYYNNNDTRKPYLKVTQLSMHKNLHNSTTLGFNTHHGCYKFITVFNHTHSHIFKLLLPAKGNNWQSFLRITKNRAFSPKRLPLFFRPIANLRGNNENKKSKENVASTTPMRLEEKKGVTKELLKCKL